MPPTLELNDGATTLDLLDSTYNARMRLTFPPAPAQLAIAGLGLRGVHYQPRTLSVVLSIKGSSVSNLSTVIRDLETMLSKAENRQSINQGTIVVLKIQTGDTGSADISYRVLRGTLALPDRILDEPILSTQFRAHNATLSLLLEPFGRLATVSPSAGTLENEQDSGGEANYMDIDDITGTHGAKLQLKIHDTNNGGGNAWNGSKKMWIAKRSGERQTDDLFIQGEEESSFNQGSNPGGGNTVFASDGAFAVAAASGGQVAYFEWNQDIGSQGLTAAWTLAGNAQYDIAGGSIPAGLYRVLARVTMDETSADIVAGDMGFALGWVFGDKSKVPINGDDIKVATKLTYEIMDMGEIVLPLTGQPDGFTPSTFSLRIYGTYHDSATSNLFDSATGDYMRWLIDYVMLIPLDEGAVILDSVGTDDRILIDSLSDTPGVYILDSSDVVQNFATFTGGPFSIGPENTRIYVLRDDTGNPSNVQFTVTPVYTPLVQGV